MLLFWLKKGDTLWLLFGETEMHFCAEMTCMMGVDAVEKYMLLILDIINITQDFQDLQIKPSVKTCDC